MNYFIFSIIMYIIFSALLFHSIALKKKESKRADKYWKTLDSIYQKSVGILRISGFSETDPPELYLEVDRNHYKDLLNHAAKGLPIIFETEIDSQNKQSL